MRGLVLSVVLGVSTTLIGCVGGKAIERSYYSIQYPMEGVKSASDQPPRPSVFKWTVHRSNCL